ncbi:MAG TPA: histidine kinase dimerization/phospho-acceptor domain-containing protein, partial [Beijerinckiaceae bacterium]
DEARDAAAPPAGPLADEIAEATAAEAEAPGDLPADDAGPDEDEDLIELTRSERSAFREIARALGARLDRTPPTETPPEPPQRPAPERSRPAAPAAAPVSAGPRAAMELLDRIDLGLLVCRDGAPIYVNKALTALLGYPDAAAFEAENGLARMFRGRAPEAADELDADGFAPVLTRTGETVALSARLQAIDWDGAPATLISLRRTQEPELAQRVRALEGDLLQRDARARELHAILDTATDGVVTLDDEGRLLSLNRSAEALFGYEQNEVAGEPFTILFARDSHAAALDYLAGLQSNGVRSVLNDGREVTGRARQGGQIPMFMTLGRIGDKPTGKFCAVLRDLTQWKNAERELKEARREAERTSALKSDFLARISHEVRTPLNAILGFAEVMRDERFGPLGNERYKDYLKDIHASGAHVLSLVNDLLDLSKIEAGKMDLSFESVDANGVVSECVSIMQSQAIRERVILRLSLAPRLPNIVADERALRQIVLNILSNAVKFNQPGGQVIVSSALTDAGAAVIRVRDTGIGMNEREIETALEPFRQVETARPTTGTGLGLPL